LTPVFWDLMRMDSPKHAEARMAVSQKTWVNLFCGCI